MKKKVKKAKRQKVETTTDFFADCGGEYRPLFNSFKKTEKVKRKKNCNHSHED